MTINKKTLYEILEVSSKASFAEIKSAHQRISQELHSENNGLSRDEIALKLKVVNFAFHTLSVQTSRDAYDAKLAKLNAPAGVVASLSLVPLPTTAVATSPKADAKLISAEALSLKAEAMSLKADAMSLKADVMSMMTSAAPVKFESRHRSPSSPIKTAFTVIGGVVAVGLVIQVAFLLLVNRQSERTSSETAKAEEKVMLQEYYQENGVRAGSKIEADMLDAERRREETEQRAQQERDRKYQQFVEDSRRQGEQVSADLRRAEQEARYEEERQKRQLEEDKRNQEEDERIRIEKELNRWRR